MANVYHVDVVVPKSESAAGFGPYPRMMASRVWTSLAYSIAFLDRCAITWRAALHDHETRYEGRITNDDGEPVWCRSYGREEKDDAEPFTKAELRKLKAEHEARFDVPVVRRGPFGMPPAETLMGGYVGEVVFAEGPAAVDGPATVALVNGQNRR